MISITRPAGRCLIWCPQPIPPSYRFSCPWQSTSLKDAWSLWLLETRMETLSCEFAWILQCNSDPPWARDWCDTVFTFSVWNKVWKSFRANFLGYCGFRMKVTFRDPKCPFNYENNSHYDQFFYQWHCKDYCLSSNRHVESTLPLVVLTSSNPDQKRRWPIDPPCPYVWTFDAFALLALCAARARNTPQSKRRATKFVPTLNALLLHFTSHFRENWEPIKA